MDPTASTDSLLTIEAFINDAVPFYDFTVSHTHLFTSCKELLAKILPTWNVMENVDFVQCKDGITNKCGLSGGETVLIRAYGKKSELIINRMAELVNFVTLTKAGLAPPLYARFRNGFVYGYVEGHVLESNDMSDPRKSKLVAEKMAKWHKVHLPGKYEASLVPTLWKWYAGVPKSYSVPETQHKFLHKIDLTYIRDQITRLEKILTQLDSPIVFCHNDLLSANIIYQFDVDDVSFIDFEYGCHNYRGFDIGNHFCEWAGLDCDYSLYPTKEQQLPWLRTYFAAFYGQSPSDDELERIWLEANLFAMASHMYWGLWGLVQASFSDIPFDYMSYAIMRFDQYRRISAYWFSVTL